MRLAVAVPSLPRRSPVRRALESTLVSLRERGHEVEAFAEHDRLREGGVGVDRAGESGIPLLHYLRLRERHRADAFDAALHPFGRDAQFYQGVFWCARTLPGLLWVLDSGLHHFVLGDLGARGMWSNYRRALCAAGVETAAHGKADEQADEQGDERADEGAGERADEGAGEQADEGAGEQADTLVDLVAAGWATGTFFRRHDLAAYLAGDQPRLAAATVPLARDLRRAVAGRPVATAPLPALVGPVERTDADPDPAAWERWEARSPRLLVATLELASPATAFRALAAVRRLCPGAEIEVCAPGLLVPGLLGPVASRLGLAGEMEWVCDAGPREMRRRLDEADAVAWLRTDPVAEDRLWLLEALAGGKPTFVLRAPQHDDLTPGAVIPVESGRALATEMSRVLEALLDDEELRRSVQAAARALAAAAPTAVDAARSLEHQLELTAGAGPPSLRDVSAATWEAVGREIAEKAVPAGAVSRVRRAVTRCLPLPPGGDGL